MAKLLFKHSESAYGKFRVFIQDTTSAVGAGLTGLTFATSGLAIHTIADNEASVTSYTSAGSTIETITTTGTFADPTATKCRFKEVDSTNLPGWYEIQVADARWAVSGARALQVCVSVTGGFCAPVEVQLALFDVNASTVTVGSISAGAITAAAIATGAIDADALATDAVTEIIDALKAVDIDGDTWMEVQRIIYAILAGKSSGLSSGFGTAVFRDVADSKNRATIAISSDGNRTSVTLDGT
jgi:hypothetical protein